MVLRVSCATPIAGPLGGVLGVGLASALAGQAALHCRAWVATGRGPLVPPLPGSMRRQDLLLDAALGVVLFKLMGGRFRSVMPSDLAKVGAIARESLPARGVEYATDANRTELRRFYYRCAGSVGGSGSSSGCMGGQRGGGSGAGYLAALGWEGGAQRWASRGAPLRTHPLPLQPAPPPPPGTAVTTAARGGRGK